MTRDALALSYLAKCRLRLEILQFALERGGYSDVVREAQECVELALKGMLRTVDVDPPRVHEVGPQLLRNRSRFPADLDIDSLAKISRELRKDRELSFYGAEDLVPTEAYGLAEAEQALEWAREVVQAAERVIGAASP